MLSINGLSSAVLFSEVEQIHWAESSLNWDIVLPDLKRFSLSELAKMFPKIDPENQDKLEGALEDMFSEKADFFEPKENYFLELKSLKHDSMEAQAILYKAQNPCKIVELNGYVVLTCSGDVWAMSDVICRAYLLLGYIPPFILHDTYDYGLNTKGRCQHFIQNNIDALFYEYRALAESIF